MLALDTGHADALAIVPGGVSVAEAIARHQAILKAKREEAQMVACQEDNDILLYHGVANSQPKVAIDKSVALQCVPTFAMTMNVDSAKIFGSYH